jgi:hypothetical protein
MDSLQLRQMDLLRLRMGSLRVRVPLVLVVP